MNFLQLQRRCKAVTLVMGYASYRRYLREVPEEQRTIKMPCPYDEDLT